MPGKLRRYDEYGHAHFLTISCYRRLQFFRHGLVKQVFVQGMVRTRARLGIRWVASVIMPEHVHVLVFPMPIGADKPVPISTALEDLEQNVGRQGKGPLRSVWAKLGTLGSSPMDSWALVAGAKPFWKTRV